MWRERLNRRGSACQAPSRSAGWIDVALRRGESMTIRRTLSRTLTLAALVPLFVSPGPTAAAQTAGPADIAVAYVRANAATFGLTAADVSDMLVEDRVLSSHTGVTHVYLQQRHRGIPVANGIVNVNVARDGTVLSAGNRFVADLAAATAGQDPAAAVGAARSRRRPRRRATSASLRPSAWSSSTRRRGRPGRRPCPTAASPQRRSRPSWCWLPLDSGARPPGLDGRDRPDRRQALVGRSASTPTPAPCSAPTTGSSTTTSAPSPALSPGRQRTPWRSPPSRPSTTGRRTGSSRSRSRARPTASGPW